MDPSELQAFFVGLIAAGFDNLQRLAVVVYIYKDPLAPAALLIRYGDSGYLVTHEKPDGSMYGLIGTKAYDESPYPLGSRLHSSLNPYNELQVISLKQQGIYRIRAYSDGLGGESYAWQILDGPRSIEEVVNEAAQWPSIHPQIGADDWSVAGFDLEAHRDLVTTEKAIGDSAPSTNAFIFDLQYCDSFDLGKLPLSDKALRFWTNTYGNYLSVTQYPLLKQFPDTRTRGAPPFSPVSRGDRRSVMPVGVTRYVIMKPEHKSGSDAPSR